MVIKTIVTLKCKSGVTARMITIMVIVIIIECYVDVIIDNNDDGDQWMKFPMIGNNDYKSNDNNKLIITSSAEDANYKKILKKCTKTEKKRKMEENEEEVESKNIMRSKIKV